MREMGYDRRGRSSRERGRSMKPIVDLGGTSIRTALVDQFIVATYGGTGSKTLVRGILNQPPPGASPVNLVRRPYGS